MTKKVLVQDAAQVMQPVECDGKPTEVDQHNDNDVENETLKSWPLSRVFDQLDELEEIAYNTKAWDADLLFSYFEIHLYKC